MSPAPPSLLGFALFAGLLSCGGMNAGSGGGAGGAAGSGVDACPACGAGAEIEPPGGEDPHANPRGCNHAEYFDGIQVQFPSVPEDRGWVLSGTLGDEPFRCSVPAGTPAWPGRCSDEPRVEWYRFGDGSQTTVSIYAHPCRLSLTLEVEGEPPATAASCPEYEWAERAGAGCGWIGVAHVVLSSDEG